MCEKPIISICQLSDDKLSAPRIDAFGSVLEGEGKEALLQDLTPGCPGKAKHTVNPRPTPARSIHQLFPARALGLLGVAEQILWLTILEGGTTEPLRMPGQSWSR